MLVLHIKVLNSAAGFSFCHVIKVQNKGSLSRNVVERLTVLLKLAVPLENYLDLSNSVFLISVYFGQHLANTNLQNSETRRHCFFSLFLCPFESDKGYSIAVMEYIFDRMPQCENTSFNFKCHSLYSIFLTDSDKSPLS